MPSLNLRRNEVFQWSVKLGGVFYCVFLAFASTNKDVWFSVYVAFLCWSLFRVLLMCFLSWVFWCVCVEVPFGIVFLYVTSF